MKKIKFKSLTMRIWTTFTAIILIIICSTSLLYMFAYRKIDENAKIADLKYVHETILQSSDFTQPEKFSELKNLKGSDHFIYNVEDNKTQILSPVRKKESQDPEDSDGSTPPGAVNTNEVRTWMTGFIREGNTSESVFKGYFNNRKYIFVISSIEDGNKGKSYLISYLPDMQDNRLALTILAIAFTFIVIGFVAAKVVAGRISKPLKELEDYTVKIAHKDWKEPIKAESEDELGRLAEAMNRMQEALKHADEEEKMFLQSISHDLKTPVMVIMSHAEAIVEGVYIDSIEETAEVIKNEAANLEKKIKQMLYLNTLDYVLENNTESKEISFDHLVLKAINKFEETNSRVDWNMDMDTVSIFGDENKLKVAIENILDNSMRYVEDNIRISLRRDNNFAVLELFNDGPCIDEGQINYIFDNRYKDKSGNFGLGLVISKKIIDFYKGEIEAINREKGVSFIIRLPMIK